MDTNKDSLFYEAIESMSRSDLKRVLHNIVLDLRRLEEQDINIYTHPLIMSDENWMVVRNLATLVLARVYPVREVDMKSAANRAAIELLDFMSKEK